MIFDEIPFELKEHIFTYVTPYEWIHTTKVSKEWMDLTIWSIKKVESCHLLILDHLAEFINEHHNTNYTWVSLLTLMPRLEHLGCCENTEDFWREISPVCHQLKILDFKPKNDATFDWNKLDITFNNLTELLWDGSLSRCRFWDVANEGPQFPFNWFAYSPELKKLTLKYVKINAKWKEKIPKSVQHILLKKVIFTDDHQCSVKYLCEDSSVLETFIAEECMLPVFVSSKFFNVTPRLKNLASEFLVNTASVPMIVKNALRNCQDLETVKARGVIITDCWRHLIPQNIKSIKLCKVKVQSNLRSDFSIDWLFQNYDCLQSLELRCVDWTGLDYQKFYSNRNLKKLYLDNYGSVSVPGQDEPIYPFADICVRMMRPSHLVDLEICKLTIDEYWRHIFPPTIKRLKLKDIHLSKEAQSLFSPQFICENPSNIQCLKLVNFDGDLPGMDLHAFSRMHLLQELQLKDLLLPVECLESILTHCSALTDLSIDALTDGALTNIPRNLFLPTLRKIDVEKPVDQPSLLLQHFPKVCTLDIAIVPSQECFLDIMQAMQVVETAEIKMRNPPWCLLRSLIESIDDVNFKYFCVTCESNVVSVFCTDSVLDACSKLNDVLIFKEHHKVLKINNYPTSSVLRENVSRVPSSMDELFQRYNELMA